MVCAIMFGKEMSILICYACAHPLNVKLGFVKVMFRVGSICDLCG